MPGHLGSDLVDVLLASDVDARDAWQIDDGQVGAVRAVNGQLYWVVDDVFVNTSHLVSLLDNPLADLLEVGVLLGFVDVEDCVGLFLLPCFRGFIYFCPREPCAAPEASW